MRLANPSLMVYCLALFFAPQSQAAYRDMKQQIEDYSPPTYIQDLTRPSPERVEPVKDSDFAVERRKIEEIKSQWLKSLSISDTGQVFFRPDDRLLESLRRAGSDEQVAGDALKGEFSLTTLETLSLLRSPKIKAAESRMRATIEAFSQVDSLDEILRQYTAFTEGLMTGVGPMKGKDSVKMKFPFSGLGKVVY